MAWDDGLDDLGKRIAGTVATPLRILAGPGTGKTYLLIRRAARLLEKGAIPQRVFACTFTRTSAGDLQQELAKVASRGAEKVRSSTLHSFCFSVLGEAEVLPLTGRVPRPLMKFEERFLIEDLARDFGGVRATRKRLDASNAAWARLYSDEPGWPTDPADRAFQGQLLSWLRFHLAMLVGELVPETLRFVRNNPESPFRPKFAHVLVDEYQDLNRAEQVLLDELAQGATVTVVGDEDQSIYSFKFAHPEGIARFDSRHLGTVDEHLETCRRCPKAVVEMANMLINNNPNRDQRVLHPCKEALEAEPYIVQWQNLEDEICGLTSFIHHRVKTGQVEPGRVLVLSPRRKFGYMLRESLSELGVNAQSFFHEEALDGNPKKLNESNAQQAFALLTLIASNPLDSVALRAWCGFGSASLQQPAWRRLQAHCQETGETPASALDQLVEGSLELGYVAGVVSRYQELKRILAKLHGLAGPELLDRLFPKDSPWAEPFRSIAEATTNQDYDARQLLDELRTAIVQPELPTDVDYVRIMSLHKSKGLTADLVIVTACIEGLVPFLDKDLAPADLDRSVEEQRRLFYVALTRTRRTLVLSSVARLPRALAYQVGAKVRGGNKSEVNTITSRFMDELGPARPRSLPGKDFLSEAGISE